MTSPVIYAIVHVETNRLYIGSAVKFPKRRREHLSLLRLNKHHSPYLQRVWNKDGDASFAFQIIHNVEHAHELVIWEQFWIDRLKPVFNMAKIAGPGWMLGVKHSVETRAKMAAAKRGRKLSKEHVEKLTASSSGRRHSVGTKEKLSAMKLGVLFSAEARANMSKAQTGKKRDSAAIEKAAAGHRGKKHNMSVEASAGIAASRAKTFRMTDPDGKLVIITNMLAFCRETGLDSSCMCEVASGKRSHHRGWRAAPKEEAPAPDQLSGQALQESAALVRLKHIASLAGDAKRP